MNQAMDPRTREMLEARPLPLLVRMASPNSLAFLLRACVSMTEVWYIGQLGTSSLAAIALVFPLLMLMQMISGGALGGAVAASVARSLGAGKRERAEATVWHALLIAVGGAGLFLLAFKAGGEDFLRFLGGKGEVLDEAMAYSWALFPCGFVLWTTNVLSAVFRGMGNMRFPAGLMIVGAAVQVILSGALILGWMGMPSLGVTGAAVSVVTVGAVQTMILVGTLSVSTMTVKLRLATTVVRRDLFADIFRVALPASLSPVLTVLTIMSLTGLVGRFGPLALAGYGIGSRLEFLLVPLIFGIGSAMTSMVGVNIGAGQWQRAERIGWLGASLAGGLAAGMGFTLAIFPMLWIGLFTDDPGVYEVGAQYLRIVGPGYMFYGIGLSLYFASQGAGKLTWPVMATILRFMIAVGGATLAVIVFDTGIDSIFYCACAGMIMYGVMTAASVKLGVWRPSNVPGGKSSIHL